MRIIASGNWKGQNVSSVAAKPTQRNGLHAHVMKAACGRSTRIIWQVDVAYDEEAQVYGEIVKGMYVTSIRMASVSDKCSQFGESVIKLMQVLVRIVVGLPVLRLLLGSEGYRNLVDGHETSDSHSPRRIQLSTRARCIWTLHPPRISFTNFIRPAEVLP